MDKELVGYLGRARDRVEKGWCQRFLFKGEKCCSIGALIKAKALSAEMRIRGQNLVAEAARESLPYKQGWVNIVVWNDSKGRTKEEVVCVFNKAIQKAIEGEV